MIAEWLRPEQAGEYCSVSRRTIYEWFKLGLPHSLVGKCRLIRRSDLDVFIENHLVGKTADDLANEILEEM